VGFWEHQVVKLFIAIAPASQSKPSYKPSAVGAHALWMYLQFTTSTDMYYRDDEAIEVNDVKGAEGTEASMYNFYTHAPSLKPILNIKINIHE
jgi:hypothetical protein